MISLENLVKHQHSYFDTGKTLDIGFRLRRLCQLEQSIRRYRKALIEALKKDLGKSDTESYMTEIYMVLSEISYIKRRLRLWNAKKPVLSSVMQFPGSSWVYREPYGVVLIMSPWNYPFQLTFLPLAGAIAAGNCAVVKPSELSPPVAEVMSCMLEEIFPRYYAAAVCGDVKVSEQLLEQPFDYIFYTGGGRVGKLVMAKAAEHLTPVSLELGGKSPCIVDETADIKAAARRILWGKCLNSGQTCVAPDYVLVSRAVKGALLVEMKKAVEDFYGFAPLGKSQWPKMINKTHYDRVKKFLKDGRIICGGGTDEKALKIEPTVLTDVSPDSGVMREEIFGPVLPVLGVDSVAEAVRFIKDRERPLALYIFSENKAACEYVIKHCHFGGGCVNDTVLHIVSSTLPFGGTGESGMGAYHGKHSFYTFSREKSILKKPSRPDIFVRYPNWWELGDEILKKTILK